VTPGGARRGRRDNGLDAAEYAVAGDVDPRVGEHLLDVLAVSGIAAYLQPAADTNPVTRTTTVPVRPTDRLYVDREHLATAKDHLARLAADEVAAAPVHPDIDEAWARIVAGYDAEVDRAAAPWPAAEDLAGTADADGPEAAGPPARAAGPGQLVDGRAATEASLLEGLDTFGADLPDDEAEVFVPPPPPPLPRISKYAVAGVLAIVVGFVLFLFPRLLPIDNNVVMLAGFGAIIAGFVTLISRLRSGDDDDYDPDDGARV
jgi:hypothetical protein